MKSDNNIIGLSFISESDYSYFKELLSIFKISLERNGSGYELKFGEEELKPTIFPNGTIQVYTEDGAVIIINHTASKHSNGEAIITSSVEYKENEETKSASMEIEGTKVKRIQICSDDLKCNDSMLYFNSPNSNGFVYSSSDDKGNKDSISYCDSSIEYNMKIASVEKTQNNYSVSVSCQTDRQSSKLAFNFGGTNSRDLPLDEIEAARKTNQIITCRKSRLAIKGIESRMNSRLPGCTKLIKESFPVQYGMKSARHNMEDKPFDMVISALTGDKPVAAIIEVDKYLKK